MQQINNKKKIVTSLVFAMAFALSACHSKVGCFESDTQCFAATNKLFKKHTDAPALNPEFNYIRLTMNGHVAWLAQGGTDQWPTANTKVYYSADRSVFKWADGRLVAISNSEIDWRERLSTKIDWSLLSPYKFVREVDTVDGLVAVKEGRVLVTTTQPDNENYSGDKTGLIWKHEYTVSKSAAMKEKPSFDHWYAFDPNNMNEPVYGQHCISKQYCMSWQVWKTL